MALVSQQAIEEFEYIVLGLLSWGRLQGVNIAGNP